MLNSLICSVYGTSAKWAFRRSFLRLYDHILVPNKARYSGLVHVAQSGVSRLSKRAFIDLNGEGTTKFLQGLVTQDIPSIENTKRGVYSIFLLPQGRVLCDAFVYSLGRESYVVECDQEIVSELLNHLKRYKLRSQLSIQPNTEFKSFVAWGSFEMLKNIQKEPFSSICFDKRHPDIGLRFIAPRDPQYFELMPESEYDIRRIRFGIPEGVKDFGTNESIPLEYNVDLMDAVNFNKGCYLGQELIARTHYKGVIRKRIVPVQISSEENMTTSITADDDYFTVCSDIDYHVPRNSDVTISSGKAVGTMKSSKYNIGLALMRLETFKSLSSTDSRKSDTNERFQIVDKTGSILFIHPIWPKWWPSGLL